MQEIVTYIKAESANVVGRRKVRTYLHDLLHSMTGSLKLGHAP